MARSAGCESKYGKNGKRNSQSGCFHENTVFPLSRSFKMNCSYGNPVLGSNVSTAMRARMGTWLEGLEPGRRGLTR